MTIKLERLDQDTMMLVLSGRLDAVSSYNLEKKLNELVEDDLDIILDLKDLGYISSSGLHILLQLQRKMIASNRNLVIKNAGGSVKNVFEMTGFSKIVNMES